MTVSLISATGISLSDQTGSSQNERTVKNRTYILRCTDPAEDQSAIQASGLVPVPGDFHPTQPTLRVVGIDSRRLKGQLWEWTPLYESTYMARDQDRAITANPLSRAIRWRLIPQHGKRVVEKNVGGTALTNSAGDVTLPLPEVPETFAAFHGTKNVASLPGWYRSLTDYLNSDPFTIAQYQYTAPPKTLLFEPGEASDVMVDAGIEYFQINFRLISKESWKWKRLDQGFYFLDDNNVRQRILVDGELSVDPSLLDGDGHLLDDPTTATARFREDDIIETRSFAPILF